ncbi:anthranilate phosphoribosyltransferase [Methylophaga lonarensis]|uniref:anthranilate phosphoribosyltransferase n=1 Tax=Methylophaga lonarensis TaxID=999151 RepID=UPI003D291C61
MTALADAIKKVATGPHLSKDLTTEELVAAMQEILSGEADEVRAAIFFIALRMKGETNAENLGVLQALQQHTHQLDVAVDDLLVYSDPFNGFNRHCPMSVFMLPVLAAAGLAVMSLGVQSMGPKFGVTHAQVLQAAGMNQQTLETAKSRLEDPSIGWAYVDQSVASPAVFQLQSLRERMIKRPSIATLEKMLLPLRARRNHLMIGFVHKAYPSVLGWLVNHSDFNSAMIMRGLEGGVIPTLRELSNNYQVLDGELKEWTLDPLQFAIEQDTRGVQPVAEKVTAAETLERGLEALNGHKGPARDSLIYGAAAALCHCGLHADFMAAANHVRELLDSGKALQQFEQGRR